MKLIHEEEILVEIKMTSFQVPFTNVIKLLEYNLSQISIEFLIPGDTHVILIDEISCKTIKLMYKNKWHCFVVLNPGKCHEEFGLKYNGQSVPINIKYYL